MTSGSTSSGSHIVSMSRPCARLLGRTTRRAIRTPRAERLGRTSRYASRLHTPTFPFPIGHRLPPSPLFSAPHAHGNLWSSQIHPPTSGIHDPVRSQPRAVLQTLPMSTAAAAKTPTKPLGAAAAAARTPTKPQAPEAAKTPSKTPCPSRARPSHASENSNPNIPGTPPPPQPTPSKPVLKSPTAAGARLATAKKKLSTPAPAAPPMERERRFFVAKKGARRKRNVVTMGGGGGGGRAEIDFDKCREAAREALRASQGEFFRKEIAVSTSTGEEKLGQERQEEETDADLEGSSKVRAMRTKAMAKAMSSVPDPGSGRVKHMVQAFESLLNISGTTSDADRAGEGSWALPGLQLWKEEADFDPGFPPVSVLSSADFQNAVSKSSESLRSRASSGGRRSRRSVSLA